MSSGQGLQENVMGHFDWCDSLVISQIKNPVQQGTVVLHPTTLLSLTLTLTLALTLTLTLTQAAKFFLFL